MRVIREVPGCVDIFLEDAEKIPELQPLILQWKANPNNQINEHSRIRVTEKMFEKLQSRDRIKLPEDMLLRDDYRVILPTNSQMNMMRGSNINKEIRGIKIPCRYSTRG